MKEEITKSKKGEDREGYYTLMELDMRTGKSKFIGYEKITFEDKLIDFYTDHHFLLSLCTSMFFMLSVFLIQNRYYIQGVISMFIFLINFYLLLTKAGVVF